MVDNRTTYSYKTAYLLLLTRIPVYIDVFTSCMPTKTPCSHTTTRWEGKLNLPAKVEFLHSDNGPRNRCKLRHFTCIPFKKDAKKNGARTERAWFLMRITADWVLSVFRFLVK